MLWENEPQATVSIASYADILWGGVRLRDEPKEGLRRRLLFPQLFRVLPNFHECLYSSIETRSTCFLFLFRKQRDEEKENNLLTLIIKM